MLIINRKQTAMKLVRFGKKGSEKPGIIDGNGDIRDVSAAVIDWTPNTVSNHHLAQIKRLHLMDFPIVAASTRLGVPIADIGKIVGIGLNYSDHAKEAGLEPPSEPIMFMKATSALSGPNDPIQLPVGAKQTDWEVELGVVIGADACNVSLADAMSHVAGYVIANDVSDRYWQLECGTQWTKGKSADTFCPIGPYFVTADDIDDPQQLNLSLQLNGEQRQLGNSKSMIFSIQELIQRISVYTTLKAGDLMITGTPPGVGFGMNPKRFLQAGDNLKLSIDGLGEQEYMVEQRH